ncbi:MAG: AMP-binding protein, partial [Pseudomonadota bacterium]
MIFESRYPPVPIRDISITDSLFEGLDARPDQPVIVNGLTGDEMTGSALKDRIQRFAGGVLAHGFKGETVAIMATNHPDYPVVFHGVAYAGGTVTTANPTYTAGELNFQLKDSGATLLVTVPAFIDTAKEAIEGTAVRQILTFDGVADGATSIDEFLADPLTAQAPVTHDHVVVLPYSSGTTGLPKG